MFPASPLNRLDKSPSSSSVLSAPPSELRVVDVLSNLELNQHVDAFKIHCIRTIADLHMLTERQMKELGIWKIGERNRLIRWVQHNLRDNRTDNDDNSLDRVPLDQLAVSRITKRPREYLTIVGAGISECNGLYTKWGQCDGVFQFLKPTIWRGSRADMMIFRCKLLDGSQRWFISIVPPNENPGTDSDVDFYSSAKLQQSEISVETPPETGWVTCSPNGIIPAPTLDYILPNIEGNVKNSPLDTRQLSQDSVYHIQIEDAGCSIVNGIYSLCGEFNGARMYTKQVIWKERETTLALFRCVIRGGEHRWYLSITNKVPGTSADLDFYSADVDATNFSDLSHPPSRGWVVAEEGYEPVPRLSFITLDGKVITSDLVGVDCTGSSTGQAVKICKRSVRVDGAGLPFINGIYHPIGAFDNVSKFQKIGNWQGRDWVFSLFRCLVKGNRRRWYISVVPTDQLPGTTHDIDFYTAACINLDDRFPPKYGWIPVSEGQGRPPCVSPVDGDTWRSSDGLQGMPNNDSSNRDASVLHERIDKTTSRGDNVRESVATTIRKIGEINHSPATNQTVTNARQISKKSDYFCERTIGQENVVTNNDDERTSRADKDTALDVIETQRDQPSLSSPSSGNLKASSCSESSITATTSTVPNRKNSIRWNPMEVFGGKEGKNRSGRRSRSRPALLANTGGDLRSGIITMGDNCSNQIER